MVTATKKKLTLAEFLAIPETQPAQEFINGEITYKSMPQGEHSRLQYILCLLINQILEIQKLAIAAFLSFAIMNYCPFLKDFR